MKKILSLLALVLLSCMGAWAGGTVVTTVKTDALYTLHCQSGADHSTARFLGDDGTTLQGRVSQPTHFRFVAAGDEMYYIQSALSGKYINAAGTTAGSAISFDAEPSTKWKVDVCENNDVALRPNGANGVSLNNYSSQSNACPYMQVGNRTSSSNACSTWVLTEYDDIATGATSAAAIETGWYQIEVGEGHGINGNHASYKGYYARGVKNGNWGMTLTQTPDTDPSSWIYITKVSEDNFQFTFNKDFSTEYTIGVTAEVANTPGNFQFKPRNNTENNYQFTIWSTKRIMGWNISNTPSLGSTSTTDNEDYNSCYFIFHKVGAPQVAEVAYTYKCEGVDDAIVYATQAIGSAFAAPVVPPFGSVTSVTEGTVATDNNSCIVNYTQTLPFVLGNVYYLGDRLYTSGGNAGNIQYYSYGDASDNKVPSRASSPLFAKNYMWTIERVANTFDQFYLKNLEFGYVSTADGNSQQSVLGANKTAMKLYEYTGAGHQGGNDFGFTDVANPTNVFGDHASSHLGYWKPGETGNEGSAFRVIDINFDAVPTACTTPDAQHAGYVTEITYYNASKVATAKAQPSVDNVVAVFDSKVSALDPNKYYRIIDYLNRDVNAGPDADTEGNAIDSNREIKTNASTTNVTSLWQFEEVSGSYYVKHVNSGLYIGKPSSGQVYLPLAKSDAGIFTVAEVNANKYLHTLRAGNYLNTNNQITQVHGWGADGDGSRWYIVEAESIPVTVGSAGYTTVNFPVAVSIPAEVKAYKVTAETAESMTLKEVTGAVPANTALIIEASENTYNFTIVSSGTAQNDNKLQGTTARRTGFGENSFYALAVDNEAALGVSFKQNGTVEAIPANKAYLPVSAGSSNKALYFDFGGITTSIDAVEVLPATDALYNINGQRVVAPTRGIYVKANGQKVFIK